MGLKRLGNTSEHMHPFPGSLKIAEALYSTFGVVSSHINSEVYAKATSGPQFLIFDRCNMGSHPDGLYIYREERSYEWRRMIREAPGRYHPERIHFLTVGTHIVGDCQPWILRAQIPQCLA